MIANVKINQKARSYEIEKEIGRGTWGRVYAAKDEYGEGVAIKRLEPTPEARQQMAYRNWDPWKVMRNEAIQLEAAACSNIVPRRFEVDNKGEPYIVMPRYKQFLSDKLEEVRGIPKDGDKSYLDSGLRFDEFVKYATKIAKGLYEIHTVLKRPYGDWKPDNIAIDSDGNPLIADLGTTSMGRSISPRDSMGFEWTRAPEEWREGGKPTEVGDSYGFGCLCYKMITGTYPSETNIENLQELRRYFANNSNEDLDRVMWSKIKKNIPQKLRKFIRKCTRADPLNRYFSGEELKKGLEGAIEDFNAGKFAKKWGLALGLPAIMLSLAGYMGATYEPQDLRIPNTRVKGVLYLPRNPNEKIIEFVREDIKGLPKANEYLKVDEGSIKRSTPNRIAACLLKSYNQASRHVGVFKAEAMTKRQRQMWLDYTNVDERGMREYGSSHFHRVVARCIEVGLSKAKTSDGKIDLEDALAIARLGEDKVNQARRAAGSFEFKDYLTAREPDKRISGLHPGSHIISEKDQNFLRLWLAYSNFLFE